MKFSIELFIKECLQRGFAFADPEDSINAMLNYIGETFSSDRAYIFELRHSDRVSNSYEWCAPNVHPQKDILQDEPRQTVDWWFQEFEQNHMVFIEDLEEIRTKYPAAYAALKPQNISSIVVGPISSEGQIIGFLGVDNPDRQMFSLLTPFLNVLGYSTASLLKQRDILRCLKELSYHDQLTGALNRNALSLYYDKLPMASVGIVYCDVSCLKQINDTLGHEAGDAVICHCYNLIHKALNTELLYRVGGDEFIALCPDCSKEAFLKSVNALQGLILQDEYNIAVGCTWSDQQPLSLKELMDQADQMMYQNKRNFYKERYMIARKDQRHSSTVPNAIPAESDSQFHRFLSATYHDMESFFQSISRTNSSSYFFFGDMQKDLFYISDNMKEDFGFQNNVVPGLTKLWLQRISSPTFRKLFQKDMESMLHNKCTCHDLRYQIRDVKGKNLWIRSYGILQWDKDKTIPLFFSGRITHQDENFVIDTLTNFPKEQAAVIRLNEFLKTGDNILVIGFSLNNITEINNTKGRSFADRLLKNLANRLTDRLSYKMSFYRLDGIRFMTIINPEYVSEGPDVLVQQIRDIIEEAYQRADVSLHHPCSFSLMEFPFESFSPSDLIENLFSLLRLAKQEFKQPYVEYSSHSIQKIKKISTMSLALNHDILNGMEHFRTMVQPIVSAKDGKIAGGEILLHWTFEGEDVSPSVFVPILEKEDMIHIAGRWVFEQAVRICSRAVVYAPDFYLAFNVSLHQLSDSAFPNFMEETLKSYCLDGSHLAAELTESCLDEYPQRLKYFVDMCQKMKIRIALDDFGSGYSSLKMLLQYTFSIIKLDRSLLPEITKSADKMNFISSIVYSCHRFGQTVCMEGVENQEQAALIKESGCDLIQGYYYYQPLEIHDFYSLISR